MQPTQQFVLKYPEGVEDYIEALALGENRYQLTDTPMLQFFVDLEAEILWYGDTIQASLMDTNTILFEKIIERPYKRFETLLALASFDTPELENYLNSISALDGRWERFAIGMLTVYVPKDSPFDPEQELMKVYEAIKLRKD